MPSNQQVTITSAEFRSYKAFLHFSLRLQPMNILVGPNNCGKSTLLGAFRLLEAGLRRARSKSPVLVPGPNGNRFGYPIPEDSLPISVENIHTNYDRAETSVLFRFSNKNRLQLYFPEERGCYLIAESQGRPIRSPTAFRNEFPLRIALVPVLGPVEHEE